MGGYSAGLALAKKLGASVSLTLYEQWGGHADEAVGAALNMNGGAAVLCSLGLSAELRAVSNPMRRVYGRTNYGLELLDVDIGKACEAEPTLVHDGSSTAVTLMRSELLAVLSNALSKLPPAQCRSRTGVAVRSLLPDGRLSLADGSVSDGAFTLRPGVLPPSESQPPSPQTLTTWSSAATASAPRSARRTSPPGRPSTAASGSPSRWRPAGKTGSPRG